MAGPGSRAITEAVTRCQLCGRRKSLTKSGGVGFHHVAGSPCPGAGFPPIEQTDADLERMAAEAEADLAAVRAELAALYDRRANWIDPALLHRRDALWAFSGRLRRRLDRHRAWPDRFARQMARQGWGDPPPDYLLRR